MTSIFTRSALLHWRKNVPPDVAYVVRDYAGAERTITWSEVVEERRRRQRTILHWKRVGDPPLRACRLEVADYGNQIFGGWQCMLQTLSDRRWVDRDGPYLKPRLMELFPCLLMADWEMWKPAFASAFARRRQCRQPAGVAFLWWDGGERLEL